MIPENIYLLTRPCGIPNEFASKYEANLSNANELKVIKDAEYNSLIQLVNYLCENGALIPDFDGFFFGYTIPQISKEFDLLKLSDSIIVNIELKSRQIPEGNIQKQLRQNKHYLSHLAGNHLFFTFISSTKKFYKLRDNDSIQECSCTEVLGVLRNFGEYYSEDLNRKFRVSDYLVSPVNTPQKFLDGAYFLTGNQDEIATGIINGVHSKDADSHLMYAIKGKPGTGKSLLLCHIAKELAPFLKVCIVMCLPFSGNHLLLKSVWKSVDIIMPKSLCSCDILKYDVIIVDETQRIYDWQLKVVLGTIAAKNKTCILGFDPDQTLSEKEKNRAICDSILQNPNLTKKYDLKAKIRTNRELSDCIELITGRQKQVETKFFPNFQLSYAASYEEADRIIDYYSSMGYQYIPYTPSNYVKGLIDNLPQNELNTHKVIGQEFDKVILILNEDFHIGDNGKLRSSSHPNPDYVFIKLFYQGVSRVREKLAILVVNNPPVFKHILNLTQSQI